MDAKTHYDNHLAGFYSWMAGDFEAAKNEFMAFCREHGISPGSNGFALDLGAGHGIQSIALAELGFKVMAVDFSGALLAELESRKGGYPVECVKGDIMSVRTYAQPKPELIVCCGDTLAHLSSWDAILEFISACGESLADGGKLLLSFRDYSVELRDTARFIPVKSDDSRILTCFLEYFEDNVRVTDLLYEKTPSGWVQKASSYCKVRTTPAGVTARMEKAGFKVQSSTTKRGLISILCIK